MRPKANRVAFKVAVIYVIIAGLWISLSDELVEIFVKDTSQHLYFLLLKGWAFVVVMGLLLYQSLRLLLARWEREATQRQEAENILRRTERALMTISACNKELVRAADETTLLREVCRVMVEQGGYRMAWVGMAIHNAAKSVRVVAQAGYDDGYLEGLNLTWADTLRGQGPTGVALRTRQIAACHDFQSDPQVEPWREVATKQGFRSSISLPICNGKLLGTLTLYATEVNAFNQSEIELLKGLSDDLAYGIQALRARLEQQALQEQLTKITASVPGVIYAFQLRPDGSSFFPYASPAIEQLFGITREILALDASPIFAGIHPADQVRVRTGVEFSAKTVTQWHDEYRFLHAERGEIWIMGRSVPKQQEDGSIIWHGFTMEITESRRQQAALAKSLSLLNATLESTADGILVVNHAGEVTGCNQKFLAMWQIPKELSVVHDDGQLLESAQEQLIDPAGFFAKVQELYEQPQASSWDELYFRDGRIFERYSQPHRLGETVVGRVWSFRDITQRKQVEATLRREQEFTRAVLDNIPAFVFWKDRELRYLGCNKLFAQSANLESPAEIVGKDDFAMPWAATAEMYRANDRQVLETQQPLLNFEEPQHRPDGTTRWLKTSKTILLNHHGEADGILGIYIDITESKQAEETMARLATAVDQAAETIVISDLDGNIVYVNPAFERSTGYARTEALGQNSNMLRSGKQDVEFYQRLWTVLQRGEIWSGHFVNRRKDGTLYEEEATISPVRNSQGSIVNYVAVKRDVTREVQLESQFRQAQKMEAIGTLAGGIAHDFNNILAAMFGYGYLLQQDTEGNVAAQENITEILQAATRAKDLVTQILTFSRQREQRRAVIHLDTVLKEALKFLRASLPANIKIEASYALNTPTVMADPTQIYQVAINLATNALHAM